MGKDRKIKGAGWVMRIMVLLCVAMFYGCAYNEGMVKGLWDDVSGQYAGCGEMPEVLIVDDGMLGGFYIADTHTVVIDKYASSHIWKHEFRHACGDTLGEEMVELEGTSIRTLVYQYRVSTGQTGGW